MMIKTETKRSERKEIKKRFHRNCGFKNEVEEIEEKRIGRRKSNPRTAPVLLIPGSIVEGTDGDNFEAIAIVLFRIWWCVFRSGSSLHH